MKYYKLLAFIFCFFSHNLFSQVVINEIQSSNINTITDEDGEYHDWIEFYNAGSSVVDLNNYGLSDDPSNPYKWTFPGVSIQPGDYLLVFASGKNRKDSTFIFLHTNFKIDIYGETLVMTTPTGIIADQKFSGYIATGNSLARIPDGIGSWCLTDVPTPQNSNNGSTCYLGYIPEPTFSLAPGFYTGSQNVSISSSLGGTEIHYTTNGSIPKITDSLYTSTILISASTVLRARCFGPSQYLPGLTASNSYLINEPTTLPVVSIIAVPGDLFDDGSGGPAVYDSAGLGLVDKTSCTIQYFDSLHQYQFTRGASFKPVGNGSLSYPQKSIQFKYNEDYGSIGDVSFNIFSKDKPGLGPSHGFRIRNMDNDWASARMRDLLINRMALNTFSGTAAYQNIAVFINGVYWGHYAAREILDEYFMRDNYGADADSVDMIQSQNHDSYIAQVGTDSSFNTMSDFLMNNNLNDSALFNQAINLADYKNWVDYFALEIYANNQDWIATQYFNNIRIARTYTADSTWKYILWDLGFSQGSTGWVYYDLLTAALGTPFYPNMYTDMMNALLQNSFFKNYFINRYADLLNYHWAYSKVCKIIDDDAEEIAPEIHAQSVRWGTPDSAAWANEVQVLRDFHSQRPMYVRNQIQNYFGLNAQVNVTLNVNPPGAGKIKISTIIPDSLPWTGIYYDGNPVKITAIPNPGFTFLNWQPDSSLPSGNTNQSITLNIAYNDTFVANFTGTPAQLKITFSEINYHSDSVKDPGDWIELHNYGSSSLDISDWYFQDDAFYHKYIFPTGTVIPQNGYLILSSDTLLFQSRFPAIHPYGYLGFNFSNSGEKLSLFDNFGNPVIDVLYDDSIPWPKCADGYGRTLELKTDTANLNDGNSWFCGCIGGSPGKAYSPCNEELIVSEFNLGKAEIMYNAEDWIELKNNTSSPMNLNGFILKDDRDYHQFPLDGIVLEPQDYVVLVRDSSLFHDRHLSINAKLKYGMEFGISKNDAIRIYDASHVLIQSVFIDTLGSWPLSPFSDDFTFEYAENGTNQTLGDAWFSGCLGGSPGRAYSACVTLAENTDVWIYPNPNNGTFTLNVANKGPTSYKLFNTYGQLITEGNLSNSKDPILSEVIDIYDVAQGHYFLKINLNGAQEMLRLIKL